MEKYDFIDRVFSWTENIAFWEAKNTDTGAPAWVLCFPGAGDSAMTDKYSQAKLVVRSLRNIPSLLPVVDILSDKDKFYVAYEKHNSFIPLERISQNGEGYPLWVMHAIAKILSEFDIRQLSGQFPGVQSVFVDEENFQIRMGFIGLSDAFHAHHVYPWNAVKNLNKYDDISHLVQCFEESLKQANVEIACRLEGESNRLDYPKLLRIMKDNVVFRPIYKETIKLFFPANMTKDKSKSLVDHLNLNDCYVIREQADHKKQEGYERDKKKLKIRTLGYRGVLFNDKGDEHYYVASLKPHGSSPSREGEIWRVRFEYSNKFIRGVSGEYHHLATLGDEKSQNLRDWKIVPEKEKAFIEKMAFEARFCHVQEVEDSPISRLAFLLNDDEVPVDWQRIEELKTKEKHLDAVLLRADKFKRKGKDGKDVGAFDDFTKERLVISVKSDRDDLPKNGELLLDVLDLKIPFQFFWRETHKKLCFTAKEYCETKREQIKTALQSGKTIAVGVVGVSGELGELDNVRTLSEIITRDNKGGMLDHASGVLFEDVGKETVPFKRQMNAVDSFREGDMIEHSLGGILATPSEHRSLITPNVCFYTSSPEQGYSETNRRLFNHDLNDSQKEAVKGALFQKPLFLIQGPPGTGKTTVIVEIIRQILVDNAHARILVCSQTNLAVDNVLERLPSKKESKKEEHTPIRKIRLAVSQDKIEPKVRSVWFKNILGHWSSDVINRSKQAMKLTAKDFRERGGELAHAFANALEKADGEQNHEIAVNRIVKEWHAFLNGKNQEIRGNVEGGWLSLETALLKSVNVIGATCVHIAANNYRNIFSDSYDCLIMDEASKATPAESLIPILRAKQVILIGDHRQLPPFVTGEKEVWEAVQGEKSELVDMGHEDMRRVFGKSLFEEMVVAFPSEDMQVMLNVQRRMPKRIGDLISKYFYEGKLQSPNDTKYVREKRIKLSFKQDTSLVFIDTSKHEYRHDNGRTNWRRNQCNSDVIVKIMRHLDGRLPNKTDFSVIAGYRGQVDLLREKIRKEHHRQKFKQLSFADIGAVVNTVDGFQGRETDIVIYDVVRSAQGRESIGFLDDPRRLNVALSRARKLLIIVGDADFLSDRAHPGQGREDADKPILGEIVDEIRDQGFVFNSIKEAFDD